THVLRTTLDPEGIEASMIVVGCSVPAVDGGIEKIGAFDQIKMMEVKAHFPVALELIGHELFNDGIGRVNGNALGGEKTDTKGKVFNSFFRVDAETDGDAFAREKEMAG